MPIASQVSSCFSITFSCALCWICIAMPTHIFIADFPHELDLGGNEGLY
jgi:hypothetical protein